MRRKFRMDVRTKTKHHKKRGKKGSRDNPTTRALDKEKSRRKTQRRVKQSPVPDMNYTPQHGLYSTKLVVFIDDPDEEQYEYCKCRQCDEADFLRMQLEYDYYEMQQRIQDAEDALNDYIDRTLFGSDYSSQRSLSDSDDPCSPYPIIIWF